MKPARLFDKNNERLIPMCALEQGEVAETNQGKIVVATDPEDEWRFQIIGEGCGAQFRKDNKEKVRKLRPGELIEVQ